MIFEVPGAQSEVQNGVRNGVQNGIPTKTALKTLLEGSWDALGGLLATKNTLDRPLGGPKKNSRQFKTAKRC